MACRISDGVVCWCGILPVARETATLMMLDDNCQNCLINELPASLYDFMFTLQSHTLLRLVDIQCNKTRIPFTMNGTVINLVDKEFKR